MSIRDEIYGDEEIYTEAQELVSVLVYLAKNNVKVLGDSLVSLSVQNILSERQLQEMQKILKKNNIKISKKTKVNDKPEKKLINYAIKRAIETLKIVEEINKAGFH